MKTGVEDAEWAPPRKTRQSGPPVGESTEVLRSMQVGDVKRIRHPEMYCRYRSFGGAMCSLYNEVKRLRIRGWDIEQYHEEDCVMVVRRLA